MPEASLSKTLQQKDYRLKYAWSFLAGDVKVLDCH